MAAMMKTYKPLGPAVLLLALLFGGPLACGGGDDQGGTSPGIDESPTTDDNQEPHNGATSTSGLPEFGGGGTAVLTVGDEQFEPVLANRTVAGAEELGFCRDVFGGLQAFGYAEADDGRIIEVTMWIPPTNWETYADGRYDPPRIEIAIKDADGHILNTYIADKTVEAFSGESQVDEYELDGTRASGMVTFTDEFAANQHKNPDPRHGSFDVNCGK
jgi:hypothetical protein